MNQFENEKKNGLFVQFKGDHQEIVFPFPFVDVISKVAVKKHNKSLLKSRNSALNHEFCSMQLPTAGLLIIENRKLLLAFSKNKHCFYLPGGKIDAGETAQAALCREIEEELNIRLAETDLAFHTHISALAYSEKDGTVMEQDCFFVSRPVSPKAAAEIGELRFFTLQEYLLQKNTAPWAVLILEQLKADNLID